MGWPVLVPCRERKLGLDEDRIATSALVPHVESMPAAVDLGGGWESRRWKDGRVGELELPSFDDGLLDSPFVAGIPSILDRTLIDTRVLRSLTRETKVWEGAEEAGKAR